MNRLLGNGAYRVMARRYGPWTLNAFNCTQKHPLGVWLPARRNTTI
ncbi:MAG: hypothetical protein KF861_23900 [Planctomycetaceae bacterium]|nr:hypothetical protein [Planctomycetaceae bacterium]